MRQKFTGPPLTLQPGKGGPNDQRKRSKGVGMQDNSRYLALVFALAKPSGGESVCLNSAAYGRPSDHLGSNFLAATCLARRDGTGERSRRIEGHSAQEIG